MASPSKKPRDIKNLKARLGRTITPGQAGVPGAPVGGGSVPPPGLGGAAPTPGPAGGVPQPGVGIPGSAPGIPGAVAAPPFAQPAAPAAPAAQPAPGPAAPAPAARAADPFAAAAAAPVGEKKVTLVIDDSAVKEDEIGRKSRLKSTILVVLGLAVGAAAGLGIGSTSATRSQYNMAVRDGKDIYAKVQEVSKKLDEAKGHLKAAVDASRGGPGKKASLDYKSIESLVALERPFSANEFHRRRYLAFPTNVVDDLFDYYNKTNLLWDTFERLGTKTAGTKRRQVLDKSAAAADGLLKNQYGMVMFKAGDLLSGGLVFVEVPQADAEKKKEEGPPTVLVSSREGGRQVERQVFVGQTDIAENYGNYVVMMDKARSMSIIGEAANLFGELRAELVEANGVMEKTSEAQGRLMKELGKVAALEETGFF